MSVSSYKRKLLISLFLAFSFLLFATEGETSGDAVKNSIPDEEKISLDSVNEKKEETDKNTVAVARDNETNFDLAVSEKSTSTAWTLFKLLISLVVVCVLLYIVLKFIKKSSKTFSMESPHLKHLAYLGLSQGKSIHIIGLGEKAYIIGVSDSSINKIGEVEDKTIIDIMNFEADKRASSPKNDFSSVFASIFPTFKKDKSDTVDEEFFKSQRERLNRAGLNNSSSENGENEK